MAHRLDGKPKVIPTERLDELCRQYRADVDRVETVHYAVMQELKAICVEHNVPERRMLSLLAKIEYMLPRYPLLAETEQYLRYNKRAIIKRRMKLREQRGSEINENTFNPALGRYISSPFDSMSSREMGAAALAYGAQAQAIAKANPSAAPQARDTRLPQTVKEYTDEWNKAESILRQYPTNPPIDMVPEMYQAQVRWAREVLGLDEDGKSLATFVEKNRSENSQMSAEIRAAQPAAAPPPQPAKITKEYDLSDGDGVKITGAPPEFNPKGGLFATRSQPSEADLRSEPGADGDSEK